VRASASDPQSKLADCTPRSVQAAVKKLAVLGLVPNAEQGEGWILPRWHGKLRVYQAVPVPGVRGMERKLMETGAVGNIESRAIYLQDHCKVRLGTENVIEHEVNFAPDPAQPNPIVGAYGVVTLKDGRREIAVRRQPPAPNPAPADEAQESGQKAAGFMSEEDRVRYSAQRLAMKGALHKFFVENRELQEVLALERASYESAVNPEARAGVPLKVDPQTQQLDVPKAEIEELTETFGPAPSPLRTAQGTETADRPPAGRRRVATPAAGPSGAAKPTAGRHPVDELADQLQQRYRPAEGPGDEAPVPRGVRL
jgi:recombinational DNA repair protein RecT